MKAYVALIKINQDLKSEQELGHDVHIDYELVELNKLKKMIAQNKVKDMGFLCALQLAEREI